MGKALFVTGTGTDVGKTFVTALVVKKLKDAGQSSGYYKAALSGATRDAAGKLLPGDALYVKEIAGLPNHVEEFVSYVYEEPVSPHLAALRSGQPINFDKVERDFRAAKAAHDFLTVEGSGGIVCPLRWDAEEKVILDDLVRRLDLPALLVADAGLGTLNAVELTVEHLRGREIPVRGVIFNRYRPGDFLQEDNRRMVEELTGIPVVACVEEGAKELPMDAGKLMQMYA